MREFGDLLDDIESDIPDKRLSGLAQLAQIADVRAFRVAEYLREDRDPQVRAQAERIFRKFEADGSTTSKEAFQGQISKSFPLDGSLDILKVTIKILKGNASKIVGATLITSSLKIILVPLLFFFHSFLPESFFEYFPCVYLSLFLYLTHQTFMLPVIWNYVGNTFISAYPEEVVRKEASKPFSRDGYMVLLKANFVQLTPLYLGFFILFFIEKAKFWIFTFLWAQISLSFLFFALPTMPLILLSQPPKQDPIIQSFMLFAYQRGNLLRAFHYGVMIWLGILILGSIILALPFFRYIPEFSGKGLVAGLIVLETILTPLWIGFRTMATRLLSKEA
ncbi:hypothetical protein HYY75_06045 [bacterium]|nr:hypothetical protein [bacterium]